MNPAILMKTWPLSNQAETSHATPADPPAAHEVIANEAPTTRHPSWFLCSGCVGLILGSLLTTAFANIGNLSVWVMLLTVLTSVLIFLDLAMATKILVGHELIIYYHHEIAVLSGIALFLRLLHQPVLPYLDIFVLGLGVFLACGRIGCLLVGCCHGRPCRWGITYHEQHAAAGFTPYYVGIPLFPVQALESLYALGIVAFGVRMVLQGSAPGSAFSSYIIAYGFGRFCFEFLRGDPERPYLLGFSEAQWTSLILMSLTVFSEFSRRLPLRPWHLVITLALPCIMMAVTLHRRFRRTPTHLLFHPRHIREVADALEYATTGQSWLKPKIPVGCTSLGIQISSATRASSTPERCAHYCLSRRGKPLTVEAAAALARIVCQLQHHSGDFDLLPGNNHVFHCIAASLRQSAKSGASNPASQRETLLDGRGRICSSFYWNGHSPKKHLFGPVNARFEKR